MGAKGWTTALESIKKMYDAGCFQDGATSAGFDALTNGASSGKILGFFAPSGAAQQIMQAAGGHVKLIALPVGAPEGSPVSPVRPMAALMGSMLASSKTSLRSTSRTPIQATEIARTVATHHTATNPSVCRMA